jgi:uncharacterized protein (DUF305 family)
MKPDHRPCRAACIVALAMVVLSGAGSALSATQPEHAQSWQPEYTQADVRFMQGMIVHHRQAVEMTALVPERSARPEIRLLARRIDIGQADEMALMRRWLEDRDEPVEGAAGDHAHGGHHGHATHGAEHDRMPGMLSPEEMERLAAAAGDEFDRLFLESMIRHHEGALEMVAELFATDGAGQEPEIFQFATHVDSDQSIEIARMRTMLESINR